MAVLLANNATSRLASSLTAAATTLAVTTGQGARFPSPTGDQWFPLSLVKANGTLEIVKCTARSGDVFTIARAQEGTASMAFDAGDRVELRATAAVFSEGQQKTADAKQAADDAQQAADDAQEDVDQLRGIAVKKDANTTTGAALLPGGTQAQRPASPANGMLRYNSEKHQFEGYQNGKWGQVGGGDHVLSVKWEASRNNIGDGGVAADGQTLSRATYPDAWSAINAGKVPVVDDAEWLSDPTKRGCFSRGDGSTTFRLPDYNGKFAGSLGAVVLRGDGALSAGNAGVIQQDAMQRITGQWVNDWSTSALVIPLTTGAVSAQSSGSTAGRSQTTNSLTGTLYTFDSQNSPGARTSTETRPLNVTGCWVIKLFGAVVNVGSADAAQLASDYANLAGRVSTLEGIGKPFTKEYVSDPSAMSNAGLLNFTHGLGAVPKIVELYAICKVADGGYTVGQLIKLAPGAGISGVSGAGPAVIVTEAQVKVICFANGLCYVTATGYAVTLSHANWDLIVRAWA